jgi:hypothetical protein
MDSSNPRSPEDFKHYTKQAVAETDLQTLKKERKKKTIRNNIKSMNAYL